MMSRGESSCRVRPDVWVLSLFAVAFVFASRSMWYDLRLIHRELLDPDRLRVLFLVYALGMLPFIVTILSSDIVALLTKRPVWFFVALAWYGLVPALIYRNSSIYILQDLFKLSLFPAGYLGYRLARKRLDVKKFVIFLGVSILLFEVARFFIHLQARGPGAALVYGTIIDVIPVAVFFSLALCSTGLLRLPYLALTVVSLVMSLVGQKRTVLACFILLGGYLIFSTFRKNGAFVVLVGLALISGVVVLVASGTVGSDLEIDVFRRIAATDLRMDLGASSLRFEEAMVALERLEQGGPSALLFGYGHGATFQIWHPVRGVETVHSMHFTVAAMVFRYGLFGLVFFCALFFGVCRLILRRSSLDASPDGTAVTLTGKGYLLSALVACFLMFGFVDDLLCGIFFGLVEDGTRRVERERD
jgi:hypothetical protein